MCRVGGIWGIGLNGGGDIGRELCTEESQEERKVDRVIEALLAEFRSSFQIDAGLDEDKAFEHFVNYICVDRAIEATYAVEDLNIGVGGTIGIDGFALCINGQLVSTEDQLDEALQQNPKCSAEIIFVQSKTSPSFSVPDVRNFGEAVVDFLSTEHELAWNPSAMDKISLFDSFVRKTASNKDRPVCRMYYAALGRNEHDRNIESKRKKTIDDVRQKNLFSTTEFEILDAGELQTLYRSIGDSLSRSFEFPKKVSLPAVRNVSEAYLGIVPASTIVALMTNDAGALIPSVFYDNVRDFQGDNPVNSAISDTLKSSMKDAFSILNNGVTIVAESMTPVRDSVTITNFQIVNGCQTAHVLYHNRTELDATVNIALKLIVCDDEEVVSAIIKSTNSQTQVDEQDLLAFSKFQKRLEEYYRSFPTPQRLYYERRSKQYSSLQIDKSRIIDKTTQIKAIGSLLYDKPDLATRYFGTLFREFKDTLFKENHNLLPYYVSSYCIYCIDEAFRQRVVDKKYKKIKYHILSMLRHEIQQQSCPKLESHKVEKYCQAIIDAVNDPVRFRTLLTTITSKIDSLNADLANNEVSKSKEFARRCISLY